MPRIEPVSNENAPEASQPVLEQIKSGLGKVPNLLATFGHSPAALHSYVLQKEALKKGSLGDQFGESIAIAMAQFNKCEYCASAHDVIGKMSGLSDEERVLNRNGKASDPKVQAGIDLARALVEAKGFVNDQAFASAREGGLSESDVLEVLTITMFNMFTNYANHMLETENDFPAVELNEAVAV